MKFSARSEQEANLGPLIATALKKDIPIFGLNSYKNDDVKARLYRDVLDIVQHPEDHVIDINDSTTNHALRDASTPQSTQLNKQRMGVKSSMKTMIDDDLQKKAVYNEPLSSSDQHDREHYATLRTQPGSKEQHEYLDKIMLRRAKNGYLFYSKLNMSIVSEDRWLQDVWHWVHCTRYRR